MVNMTISCPICRAFPGSVCDVCKLVRASQTQNERETVADNQRRVRDVNDAAEESEDIDFDQAVILESDETAWVLIGDTWVDVSRIVSVSPAYVTEDDAEKVDLSIAGQGVSVQLDVYSDTSQFVHTDNLSVEEVMGRILDATTDGEDEDDDK